MKFQFIRGIENKIPLKVALKLRQGLNRPVILLSCDSQGKFVNCKKIF
jgi:hypothetical protein